MWVKAVYFHLITLLFCAGVQWTYGLEKDIEVACLDGKATTITEGGVEANCAFHGLTRTTTISPWLVQIANVLQALNVSHNHIKKVAVLPVLPRLLSLTLDHNSIREIEPLAFTGLENLQTLDLSNNRISGESLRGVLSGKKAPGEERYEPLPIRVLKINHNNISTIEPSVLAHLQFLRDLHLDYNPISEITDSFLQALQELPELKLLSLTGTRLTTLPKDAFSGLQLTTLFLDGNQFTRVPELSALGKSLKVLNLNQNPIEELNEASFTGMQKLYEIKVSGMSKLSKIGSRTFSRLENIRIISCTYNPKLVEIDETALWNHNTSKRSSLQEVYLNNNGLPRLKKNVLPWLKMSKVTLDGNPWVCDCHLHWLALFLRSRSNTVDRLTELKCHEPLWLNGKEMVFWEIDTKSRHENYPCLAEQEEERLLRQKLLQEQRRLEQGLLKNIAVSPTEKTSEGIAKLYYLVAIAGVIAAILILGSVIAFNKYRNYRPINNTEKVSIHNEMKYIKGSQAERTQLVL